MPVLLNHSEGIAQIGRLQVGIRLTGHDGSLQVNGDQGPCLSPVSFLERSRIASYATVSRKPSQAMAKLVAEASLLNPKQSTTETDPAVVAIIALVLAGASETDLPSFAESALLVSRQSGWSPEQLGQTNATDIDNLARQLTPEVDDGWVRLKFNASEETDLNLIQNELADNLLIRLQSRHDMLHLAGAVNQPAAGSISNNSQSGIQLAEQQAPVANSTLDPANESSSKNPGSAENTTSTITAGIAAVGNDNLSSATAVTNRESLAVTSPRSENGMDSGNNSMSSVAGAEMEPSRSGDRLELTAGATPVLPVSVKNNHSTSRNHNHSASRNHNHSSSRNHNHPASRNHNPPDTAEVMLKPKRLSSSNPTFLADGSHEYISDNSPDKYAQSDKLLTDAITLQSQDSAKTNNHKEIQLDDFLDEFAVQLHLEADLRGIDR